MRKRLPDLCFYGINRKRYMVKSDRIYVHRQKDNRWLTRGKTSDKILASGRYYLSGLIKNCGLKRERIKCRGYISAKANHKIYRELVKIGKNTGLTCREIAYQIPPLSIHQVRYAVIKGTIPPRQISHGKLRKLAAEGGRISRIGGYSADCSHSLR